MDLHTGQRGRLKLEQEQGFPFRCFFFFFIPFLMISNIHTGFRLLLLGTEVVSSKYIRNLFSA